MEILTVDSLIMKLLMERHQAIELLRMEELGATVSQKSFKMTPQLPKSILGVVKTSRHNGIARQRLQAR